MKGWILINEKTNKTELVTTEKPNCIPEGFNNHRWLRVFKLERFMGEQ